jgi:tape measure domain-containing protein
MRFDNKNFENNVQTSISSVDKLKKGLNLDESAKSLSNLDRVGKSFSLASISDGVDAIREKFSTLGIIGITTIQNITNTAVNAGKRMISALTIDPIKTGFEEYETKMGSIQTILTNTASKGTKLEDVTAALNELNAYSDQTIYNFAEMTRNIGTFTAAGVGLKDSALAIKGIANLAAGSGSSSVQASTAMYQLSQALATGTVKLMDWNSVVNAGMGGELFKKALLTEGKALKKVQTEMVNGQEKIVSISSTGKKELVSFRDSLESGWLSTEVLMNTLSKFASDKSLLEAATQVKTFTQLFDTMKESVQSGWAQSWESIIGNKEEAAKFFTAINNGFGDIVGKAANARNAMLAFWKDNGGRDALIQSLANAFNGLKSIIVPIKEAFNDIFPPMTGEKLVAITKSIRDLTANFKIGEGTAKNLKNTFSGLFALLDLGKMAFEAIVKGIARLVGALSPAAGGVLAFTGNVGEYITSVRNAAKESDFFNKVVDKVATVFEKVVSFVSPAVTKIKNFVVDVGKAIGQFVSINTAPVDEFTGKIGERFKPFSKLAEIVEKAFGLIVTITKKMAPIFYELGSKVADAMSKLQTSIANGVHDMDFSQIFDAINGGLFAAILVALRKFITKGSGVFDGIKGMLDGLKGCLTAWQQQLKANTLIKIATAIGIIAASVIALSMVDSAKLTIALGAVTAMFADLFGSMAIFEKITSGEGFKSMGRVTRAMIALSIATLILSFAVKNLASLSWDELNRGLSGVTVLITELVAASTIITKTSGELMKGSVGIIAFAVAILILTKAVQQLSSLSPAELTKGLIGVGVVMGELVAFMKLTDSSGMSVSTGVSLILLAAAITILAKAVSAFGTMDPNVIVQGLLALTLVLAELAFFVTASDGAKNMISVSTGMVILAAAMLIFTDVIAKLGALPLEQLGKGLLAMSAALIIVVAAANLIPKNMVKKAIGMIGIAAALLILTNALTALGAMSWEEIGKSLVALAGSLAIVVLAMIGLQGALPGAAALLVISAALAILAPVLATLGNMGLEEIGKALLALVGVFTVLGVAGLVLGPITPIILALGAALALLGAGMALVGVGMLAFSAGLAALAVTGTAGAAALVIIVSSILGLIPMFFKQLGQGFVEFAKVLGDNAPVLLEAIVKLLLCICQAIIEVTPKLVDAVIKLCLELIRCFNEVFPPFIDAVLKALTVLLEKLAEYVPRMVDAGMKILIGFLEGIAKNIKDVVKAGIEIIVQFLNGVAEKIPDVIDAGFNIILQIIEGLAQAISKYSGKILKAMVDLIVAIAIAIGKLAKMMSKIGGLIVDGIIAGFTGNTADVEKAASDLGKEMLGGVKDELKIHSPSRAMEELGMLGVKGLVNGVVKLTSDVWAAGRDVGREALSGVKGALMNLSSVVTDSVDSNPTIQPVMDLTNIQNGTKKLNKMMADTNNYSVDGSIDLANRTAVNMSNHSNANNNSISSSDINGLKDSIDDLSSKPSVSVNNTFNIDGSKAPRETADEVSRTIQRQIERRDAVYG